MVLFALHLLRTLPDTTGTRTSSRVLSSMSVVRKAGRRIAFFRSLGERAESAYSPRDRKNALVIIQISSYSILSMNWKVVSSNLGLSK